MKIFLFCVIINLASLTSSTQSLIHAHNDYQQPEPLINALRQKVFSIEADVYFSDNKLLVAHDKQELIVAKRLDSLYLLPIIKLFHQHKGTISEDSSYAPILMIDIKDNSETAITHLIKLVSQHRSVFDRSVNAKAVQLVISGDRGAPSSWTSYPSYIFFDGRPKETYDSTILQRVAFISDSYLNYINPQDSMANRVGQILKKVHGMNKLFRLWGCPDNVESWKLQQELGVDIINTDKIAECRRFFKH